MKKNRYPYLTIGAALLIAVLAIGLSDRPVVACGGFFCQNSPVDQNAERIIFTDNGDGTTSALIQIQYTGSAPDFSWILPLSTPITADDIAVPEDAAAAFTELEIATNPVIIPPPVPDCLEVPDFAVMESAADDEGVEVFASGEVGPFGFDVIGSEDPTALIMWLRDNQYRVEEQMEPLINVYVEEGFYFLAMRLLPDAGVDEIAPVQVTYGSTEPMIPLRLTAVAANPNMAVLVWFFGSAQAKPVNFAHMEIADEEIVFSFSGNNYRTLLGQRADTFDGKAFITEYARPTSSMGFSHPLLQELNARHTYLTRLNTVISPEEMTADPVFVYDPALPDVDNVRDLSSRDDAYDCQQEPGVIEVIADLFGGDSDEGGSEAAVPENTDGDSASGSSTTSSGRFGAAEILLLCTVFLGFGFVALVLFVVIRRRAVS